MTHDDRDIRNRRAPRNRRAHRPHARPRPRDVLAGLMTVLATRGVEADWHDRRKRDHIITLVGGDNGLEVHVFYGHERFPRLGRMILIQAVRPALFSPDIAPKVAFFCDRGNENLYASKLYLRHAPGDDSVFQLVVERGCLPGQADLFRIADEFDLLATEYAMVEQQLQGVLHEDDALEQAEQLGLLEKPVATGC